MPKEPPSPPDPGANKTPGKLAKIKLDPLGIIPGDTINILVTSHRFLPSGTYECRVLSLVTEGPRHEVYRLEYTDAGTVRRVNMTLYHHEKFLGQCFLNGDEYPVAYQHKPNLEERIRLSIQLLQRRQK